MENKNVSTSFAFAVIILLAVTFGAAFWFMQKSISTEGDVSVQTIKPTVKKEVKDETADPALSGIEGWQTYKNEKYGFEFKYPKELIYKELEIPINVQEAGTRGEGYIGPDVFSLTIAKNANEQEILTGITIDIRKRENSEKIVPDDAIEQRVSIAGKEAIKHSGSYYIENGEYIYGISSFGGDTYYDNVLEKMLSSTRFFTPYESAATSTTNWVNYKHKATGVSFSYPQEYFVGSNELGTEPEESLWIEISHGEKGYLGLTSIAMPSLEKSAIAFNPKQYNPKDVEKWDIKKIAEVIREMNVENNNPYVKNNKISSLKEIIIDGRVAYKFSATLSYNDWGVQESLNEEMAFVFTTNTEGKLLKIYYPVNNEVSKKIFASIKFS